MSTFSVIQDYIYDRIQFHAKNNNPCPTMQLLSNECNNNGLLTPRGKEITIQTIQRAMKNADNIRIIWETERKKYGFEDNKIINVIEPKPIQNIDNSLKKIQEFCYEFCRMAGKNKFKIPTLQLLATTANDHGLKTPRGNEITISTIQRCVTHDTIMNLYEEGLKESGTIQIDEQFFSSENGNDIELKKCIEIYCKGKGFQGHKKPTLPDICDHVNSMGFRSSYRRSEWTVPQISRLIQTYGIDVPLLWANGLKELKNYTKGEQTPETMLQNVCYEWGLKGGNLPPNRNEISEYLYSNGYTNEKGNRINPAEISRLLIEHNINRYEWFNKGADERNENIRREMEEIKLNEQFLTSSANDTDLNSIDPTPSLTYVEESSPVSLAELERWKRINLKGVEIPSQSHTSIQTPYEPCEWLGQREPPETFTPNPHASIPNVSPSVPADLLAWANPSEDEVLGEE